MCKTSTCTNTVARKLLVLDARDFNSCVRLCASEQAHQRKIPVLEVLRVLRLVRLFKVIKFYKQSFDLITSTFADSFTTLNTIVFLIVLSCIILSALMFSVEAGSLDPLTHVRPNSSYNMAAYRGTRISSAAWRQGPNLNGLQHCWHNSATTTIKYPLHAAVPWTSRV